MSYVSVPPAYYQAQQPDTLYRTGAPGWWKGWLPGWGENPNSSWAPEQAAHGLGKDESGIMLLVALGVGAAVLLVGAVATADAKERSG